MRTRRDFIHHHNSFLGHVAMAQTNMRAIMESNTATTEAKDIAMAIWNKLNHLKDELKIRDDRWLDNRFRK